MPVRLALLAVLLAAPAAARPLDVDESGLVLALRAGYGVPFGTVERDGAAVDEIAASKVPLWLELGYRFDARFQGVIYFELAPARVAAERCARASCEAAHGRLGVAAQVHLAPRARIDPWLGVGVGVEVLRAEIDDPDPATTELREITWAGLELPLLDAGVDVRVTHRFSLGPYFSVSFGQFTSRSERPGSGSTARASIHDREAHGWFQGGLKATLIL